MSLLVSLLKHIIKAARTPIRAKEATITVEILLLPLICLVRIVVGVEGD